MSSALPLSENRGDTSDNADTIVPIDETANTVRFITNAVAHFRYLHDGSAHGIRDGGDGGFCCGADADEGGGPRSGPVAVAHKI